MEAFDFGMRLQELRNKKQLSQTDVAEKLDIHPTTVSSYERNIVTPSLEVLMQLAKLYGASLDYIVGFTDRCNIYVDDLTPSEQQTIVDMIDRLIGHFKAKLKGVSE